MNFTKRDAHHVTSDCGSYTINKAGQGKGRIVYMAVAPRGRILGTWPCADEPGERAAAYNAALSACRDHASAQA
jgi:hypothetical protein